VSRSSGGIALPRIQPTSPPFSAVAAADTWRASDSKLAPSRKVWTSRAASCATTCACAGLSTGNTISESRYSGSPSLRRASSTAMSS
jgi:hypothetical protein